MANGTIQLPYTGTTSGKIMDASELSVAGVTVERERLVVADDTVATALAPVTSSYGLAVDLRSTASTINVLTSGPLSVLTTGPLQVLSSGPYVVTGTVSVAGTVTVVSASSGAIQTLSTGAILVLTSGPLQVLTSGTLIITGTMSLSSGIVTLSSTPVVNSASSGFVQALHVTTSGVNLYTTLGQIVQVYGSSGVSAPVSSSGGMTVTISNPTAGSGSSAVNIVGTSNATAPATSSGGLLVTFTNASAGSTQTNVQGSTGTNWAVSSIGAGIVELSSDLSKGTILSRFTTSTPAPIVVASSPAKLYQITVATTGAISTVLNAYNFPGSSAGGALTSVNSSNLTVCLPAAAGSNFAFQSARGAVFNNGITLGNVLTAGSTAVLGIINYITVEWEG